MKLSDPAVKKARPEQIAVRSCRALSILIMLMCSSCQWINPTVREYEALFAKQKMIIGPYSSEYASSHGRQGFVVTMKPEEARKANAPNSATFREMLDEQLVNERLQGKNYCPHGYEIHDITYFKHWYTEIAVDCKQDAHSN